MISTILNECMSYTDALRAKHDENGVKALQGLFHKVNRIYWKGEDNEHKRNIIVPYSPNKTEDEIIQMIDGVQIMEADGMKWYELDKKHFDYPMEVINYVINERNTYIEIKVKEIIDQRFNDLEKQLAVMMKDYEQCRKMTVQNVYEAFPIKSKTNPY